VITVGIKGRLYTTGDLADRLGVGRQRAYVLSRMKDFPDAYEEWPNGLTVWRVEDIEAWIRASRYAAPEGE
jgi:prophage regulatory protein